MSEASNRPSSLGPAREGLDREQQEILAELERKRQEYEPLHKAADRANSRQMRVYNEILDLERRLAAINEAMKVLA
jgi:hypothetical protein